MNGVLIFAIILFLLIIGIGVYYYMSTNDGTLPDGGGPGTPPVLDPSSAISNYIITDTSCPPTYAYVQDTSQDIAEDCGGSSIYPCYVKDTASDPSHRLTDVKIIRNVKGDIDPKYCPSGYIQDPTDFNMGCGGHTVKACYLYESNPDEYIDDIMIRRTCVAEYEPALGADLHDTTLSSFGINYNNLKSGTGSSTPNLYMCLHKQKKPPPTS